MWRDLNWAANFWNFVKLIWELRNRFYARNLIFAQNIERIFKIQNILSLTNLLAKVTQDFKNKILLNLLKKTILLFAVNFQLQNLKSLDLKNKSVKYFWLGRIKSFCAYSISKFIIEKLIFFNKKKQKSSSLENSI